MSTRVSILCSLLLWSFFPLIGQSDIPVDLMEDLTIRNIGPAGMSGRVTAIDVDLTDSDIIYVGTASGGAWKSMNGGISWKPIFDDQPVQSIGALAVSQKNPDVIWVGTGEGNPRNSMNSGEGIYKSLDGGETWTCMGLKATKTIHRILIHPDDPQTVYAGALGSVWGPNEERGVYKTTDGGKTWNKILYANEETGVADMIMDPTNPNKILVAMWEMGRKPWTFNSGGPGSGLFVTLDGGETWQERTDTDGLPKGELGRIGLAMAPSSPNIVYALVEAKENGFYKSTDGGRNWSKVKANGNYGNRPFYYSDIFVDPVNENRIYSLHSLVTISEDGGRNWRTLLPYSGVHPDHHAFWVHPDDPNYLIEGNDGGLNISRDRGESWRFIPNLPLAQFYHISYDMDIPYNVAGGMQDNGSWVGPSQVWQAGGITNARWQEVYFGDGFDVQFKPDDNRYVYAMSQGGNVGLVDTETGQTKRIKPTHPDADVELRFNWNAAIALDPFNDCGVYYGSQYVHYSTDCGDSWEVISPDLTTNDTSKQKQHLSGGLTIDDTQAENHTTILAIAPDHDDKNTIWVGTDDGNLQLTRDGGETWTNLSDRLPDFNEGAWIPFIHLSSINDGEAFVVVNDYRRNDYRPMAYHTDDYGQSWTKIVDEEQANGHALSLIQDLEEPNLLFLGTDFGLYVSVDYGKNWTKWTHFPSVSTADLAIHPREHDLIIGTFGRAAWIMDDIRPLRKIAATNGEVLDKDLAVFETPDAYLAEYKSFTGVRFAADGMFRGQNRRGGAMMTVWRKPPGMDEDGKKKKSKGKAKVHVFNAAGDTIRTYSTELDTGMNRVYWPMNRNGVETPSRRDRRPDADPPSGPSVLPGTYKVVIAMGDVKDSTEVAVNMDPRIDMSMAQMRALDAAYREWEDLAEKATEGFNRLKDARKTIDRINKAMEMAPDTVQADIKKMGKAMLDSLAQLEELYMQPEGLKGIQRTSDNVMGKMYNARGYIGSSMGAPNQAAQRTMEVARDYVSEALDAINDFFMNDFKEYQEKVEGVSVPLFKEYEPVRMND